MATVGDIIQSIRDLRCANPEQTIWDQLTPVVDVSKQTPAELAAGVTPTNYGYAPGNVLRYGTNTTPGTTDMTAAIIAANSQRASGGAAVYFPAGTYAYTPLAAIDIDAWSGDSSGSVIIKVDAATGLYAGTVFRHTGSSYIENLTISEKSSSRTYPGIMVQIASDPPTGVGSSFVAYMKHRKVAINGGAICRDIQNVYQVTFDSCSVQGGGTGTKCIPDATAGGFANTLVFINEFNNNNNRGWNVAPTVGSHCITIVNGATQEQQTTSSLFQNITGLSFHDHYLEQLSGTPTTSIAINGCLSVFARIIPTSSNCDLSIGTNTNIVIDGWVSGTSHIIGGDGTQNVKLNNCALPTSGNAGFSTWASLIMENTTYSGVFYQSKALKSGAPLLNSLFGAAPTIASASTIAPTSPVTFVSGTATIQNITAPADLAAWGGFLTLIPAGLWSTNNAGNVQIASTGVVSKALTMYFDFGTSRWYPSY